MKPHWNIIGIDPERVAALSVKTGFSQVICHLLIQRGMTSPDAANAFLHPSLTTIRSPFLMKGINRAVERIIHAIHNKENILIFGDYDADGITGTILLHWFLNYTGARVSWYIPHRINEGYSFKPQHVTDVLIPGKADLVITVDCGSDSVEAVRAAHEKGIDVVITDHHSVPDPAPSAVALVNPKQPGCPSQLAHLAGVGVVFYLLIALRKALRDGHFWKSIPEPNLTAACDLVAVGTIADIVPLVAENRIFTQTGIDLINKAPRTGIKALIDSSKINKSLINTEDIAYKIGPRINAAGRIEHARLAAELLSEDRISYARKSASVLEKLNSQRQGIELQMLREIETHLEKNEHLLSQPSIVLHRQGWHVGILGIVAARLTKKYYKPVILISLNGDTGKGSGRSVTGIDLYKALLSCSDSLNGFGGHAMAGGLELHVHKLKDFGEAFNRFVGGLTKGEPLTPSIDIHGPILFDAITPKLLDELELLQPFGNANPEPLFMSQNIRVMSTTPLGSGHRRLVLRSEDGQTDKTFMAMHFNVNASVPCPASFNHLVYKLKWNRWNNTQSPQLIIEDFD